MYIVEFLSEGNKKKAKINKIFLDRGPFCIYQIHDVNGFPKPIGRFDQILDIEVLGDLSTKKTITHTEGTSTTTAKTGNLVKRAVIGGVLTGVGGAVIGGVTGTKETEIKTKSESFDEINYLVQLKLQFIDKTVIIINVNNPEITDLLYSYIGKVPLSDAELSDLKKAALEDRKKILSGKEANFARDQDFYEQANEIAKNKLRDIQPMDSAGVKGFTSLITGAFSIVLILVLKSFLGLFISILLAALLFGAVYIVLLPKLEASNAKKRENYQNLFDEEVFKQVMHLKESKKNP